MEKISKLILKGRKIVVIALRNFDIFLYPPTEFEPAAKTLKDSFLAL